MRVVTDLNLAKNQLLNAIVQNLDSPPTSPKKGQFYFNTVSNKILVYNGSDWVAAATASHVHSKSDVGLDNVDNVQQASLDDFNEHVEDTDNPHGVTKTQVGLGSVSNYGIATQTEAEAGTASNKYMTPQRTKQAIDVHGAEDATLSTLGHIKHALLTTTLNTTWSGSAAPYTKTQTVSSILSTDTPFIDVVMSGTYATDEARQEAWNYIYRAVTGDDSITFYASEKPTVELPIQIRVIR
jgi:hypothetical protein